MSPYFRIFHQYIFIWMPLTTLVILRLWWHFKLKKLREYISIRLTEVQLLILAWSDRCIVYHRIMSLNELGFERTTDISRTDDRILSFDEIDEENIHWGIFCTRIFALIALIFIIVCLSIGELFEKFFYLAAIVGGLLLLIIVISFIPMNDNFCRSRYGTNTSAQREALISHIDRNTIESGS